MKISLAVCGVAVIMLTLGLVFDVVSRYGFHAPTKWGYELAQFLMVYVVFLALGAVMMHGKHVSMDMVTGRLSQAWQAAVEVAGGVIGLGLFVVAGWGGAQATYLSFVRGETSANSAFPLWLSILPIPIGSFGLCLALVIHIQRNTIRLFNRAR